MDRRDFLAMTVAAGAVSLPAAALATTDTESRKETLKQSAFKLKYAPHLGMFENSAGKDPAAQIQFMADQGFTAFEDNGMAKRPVDEQVQIADALKKAGLTMGVFVAHADFGNKTFVTRDPEIRKTLVAQMKEAVQVAKRLNAKWCTVVCDAADPHLDSGFQTANVVDNLRACAEVCEPEGLVMVLEPLNRRDHPGLFLTGVPQAFAVCRAVNSPSCKILMDLYHQQITEGNLIPNMDAAWDEIGYFQMGDNPGRKEPGTGEINYRNVFKHIHDKGFKGVLGMEHGKSKDGVDGEKALLASYRTCDDF